MSLSPWRSRSPSSPRARRSTARTRLCNEIGARAAAEGRPAELAELQGKKAAQEGEVGAAPGAPRGGARGHRLLRREVRHAPGVVRRRAARNTRGAGIVAPEELAAWREESMRGWYALAGKHQAERAAADQSRDDVARGAAARCCRRGRPASSARRSRRRRRGSTRCCSTARRAFVAALIERLRTGRDSANNPMLGAEGLFRLSAEADDVESLVRQLSAPDARGAAAACSNPTSSPPASSGTCASCRSRSSPPPSTALSSRWLSPA